MALSDPGDRAFLIVCASSLAAIVALLAAPLAQLRILLRRRRRPPSKAPLSFFGLQLAAGAAMAGLLVAFELLLARALQDAPVDLRHFSLHPWSSERLTLLVAILSLHLAAMWASVVILAVSLVGWRAGSERSARRLLVWLLWTAPSFAVAVLSVTRGWQLPALGVALSAAACATCAWLARRAALWFRHVTVAARILALFVAFLLPALVLYPSVNYFTGRTLRGLIAGQFAVQAQRHPEMLQDVLAEVRHEIDAVPNLADFISGAVPYATRERSTEAAFLVWRQTALARDRLTSAVELYDPSGQLVSRFALNFPEYTGTIPAVTTAKCEWEWFGEAARFGSEERRMLHAERGICEPAEGGGTRTRGSIVLHIISDYRTLPFITSQSPYFEVFRTEGGAPREGTTGSDVEIVIYGWGLTPIYASGPVAWPITQDLFDRLYKSREPFWTELDRGETRWHVYFSNDQNGIYALGYPALTLFDRFVHLAELATLAGLTFVLVMIGTAMFTRVARERPRVGRALLREIRASFYRKLFLAFVAASVVPVIALAILTRAYIATQLRDSIESAAGRTASVAKRVVDEIYSDVPVV